MNDVYECCGNWGLIMMFMKVVTILGSAMLFMKVVTIHNDVCEFVVIRIPKDVDKGTL
jgi:hypothetical protein